MRKTILLFSLPLFLAACSDDKKPDKPSKLEDVNLSNGARVLTVTDESGQALPGARILIGSAIDQPFAGNWLSTNQQGQVAAPPAWSTPESVTVDVPGYVRMTYLSVSPKTLSFQLRRKKNAPRYEINGKTSGHPVKDRDGQVDFGLVMAAMSRNDFLAFDLNKIISSQTDPMSVVGTKVEIPSNVTLPKQKESYLIVPVTLDKPNYRLYFSDLGIQRIFAARARVPFKTLTSIGDKKFYELINAFDIAGGVVRDVNLNGDRVTMEMPVNELNFSQKRNARAPAFNGDEVMVALSAADLNGYLIPTDVKRFNSQQRMALNFLPENSPQLVGVLKRASEFDPDKPGADRLSATILPFTEDLAPTFLPLVDSPRRMGSGELMLTKPQNVDGVNALATYGLLSEIQEVSGPQNSKITFLARTWEVYAPEWIDTLTLPQWPETSPTPNKQRWEVSYLGSQRTTRAELGQPVIDATTHATHSSLDF